MDNINNIKYQNKKPEAQIELQNKNKETSKTQIVSKSSENPTASTSKAQSERTGEAKDQKGRNITEYKKAKRELENARFILKKAEEAMNSNMPADEERVRWAKEVLLRIDDEKVRKLKIVTASEKRAQFKVNQATKRDRSDDTLELASKKAKVKQTSTTSKHTLLDKIPFCDIVNIDLRVCIVDLNDNEWRVSRSNFNKIENFVVDEIFKYVEGNPTSPAPVYRMDERFRGYHVITCNSQNDVDFLRKAVVAMGNLWEGANLDVKTLREIPTSPKLFIAIPVKEAEEKPAIEKKVLCVLKAQNPTLNVQNWKILKVGNTIKDRDRALISLKIDADSVKTIEADDFMVNYGVRKVKVTITRNQTQAQDELEKEIEKSLIEQLGDAQLDDADSLMSDEETDATPIQPLP